MNITHLRVVIIETFICELNAASHMDSKKFDSTGKDEFEIVSGRLFIADPFHLGYPLDLVGKLRELTVSDGFSVPFNAFSHGGLYYTTDREGIGGNHTVGIYRAGDSILIARNDDLITAAEYDQELRKSRQACPYFESPGFLLDSKRIVSEIDYSALQRPLFETVGSLCYLLVGDANKFSVQESAWEFKDPFDDPSFNKIPDLEELRENHKRLERELTKALYARQVLDVPNGIYRVEHKPEEETLILKLVKNH